MVPGGGLEIGWDDMMPVRIDGIESVEFECHGRGSRSRRG